MIGGGIGSYIGKFHRWGAMLDDSAELVCGCFSRSMDRNRATAEAYHLPDTSRVSGCPPVQTICSMPARGFPASVQAITKPVCAAIRPEASGWTYKAAPSLFDGSPPVLKVQRDFLL